MADRLGRSAAAALVIVWLMAASPAGEPPASAPEKATEVTSALLDTLLAEVVTSEGLVDYPRLMRIELRRRLDETRAHYERGPIPETGPDRVAFLINAYNVHVLTRTLSQYRRPGFRSVSDIPGFFDRQAVVVGGKAITLNDLENRLLRPLGEPRIHAALVCGARSCPPLRREAYRGSVLDRQLDEQSRRWINDPAKNRVDGDALYLSRILEWYGADFAAAPYGGIVGYVKTYAKPNGPIDRLLASRANPEVAWLEYDWAINLGVIQEPDRP